MPAPSLVFAVEFSLRTLLVRVRLPALQIPPPPPGSPAFDMPRVIVTPLTAAVTPLATFNTRWALRPSSVILACAGP